MFTKSDSVDDHIADVERVFRELEKNGITVKASKLKLGLRRIAHLLTENGITPNPEKTKVIKDLPIPTNVRQLRRVLGIFAYYRKFIAKFSTIAAPLYELTGKGIQNKFK